MSAARIHLPLSPLDNLLPPNYTCAAIYLPFKPRVRLEEAFEILQDGWHKTFVQFALAQR